MIRHSVTQINALIYHSISKLNLKSVLVEGEVSNFSHNKNGHLFLSLKDENSKIECVVFQENVTSLQLKNGDKLLAKVDLNFWKNTGQIRLSITKYKLIGLGDLNQKFLELRKKLYLLGLFNKEYKKNIPEYPKSIGVITSVPSAALKDVLKVFNQKCPIIDVKLYPTLVQGEYASQNIIQQLKIADAENHDTLLLVRGGGSIEDLWCFNNEQLAYTIFELKTPIITGVGHEHDITIVDYVADHRSATPTAAANDAVYDLKFIKQKLIDFERNLQNNIQYKYQIIEKQFIQLKSRNILNYPKQLLKPYQLRLSLSEKTINQFNEATQQKKIYLEQLSLKIRKEMQNTLEKNINNHIKNQNQLLNNAKLYYQLKYQYFEKTCGVLNALSPLAILSRGYSIVKKENQIISDNKQLNQDDEIQIQLFKGIVKAKISEVKDE